MGICIWLLFPCFCFFCEQLLAMFTSFLRARERHRRRFGIWQELLHVSILSRCRNFRWPRSLNDLVAIRICHPSFRRPQLGGCWTFFSVARCFPICPVSSYGHVQVAFRRLG